MKRLLPPIEIVEEAEGATLLCLPRRGVPFVSAWIDCPGGRWLEGPRQAGLADLTAALVNQGPEGMTETEWHVRLEQDALGVSVGAMPQQWRGAWSCLSQDARRAQDELVRLMGTPGLRRKRWSSLKRRHGAAAREAFAQPLSVVRQLPFVQALGQSHPYAHIRHEGAVRRCRYVDAAAMGRQAFHRRGPVHAAVAGDIAPDEGIDRLRALLGSLGPPDEALPAEPAPAPSRAPVWLVDHPKLTQAFLALSRPGVRAGDPERVALRLAVHVLGGPGLTSRLMKRARVDVGHTYGIYALLPENRALNPFIIWTFTHTGSLRAMLDVIDRVLAEVAADGFTQEELQDARSYLHDSAPLRLIRPGAVLQHVQEGLEVGLGVDDLEEDWQAILTTPAEQVHAAARRLIGDGSFRLAVIGPAADLRPQLDGRGEIDSFSFTAPPDDWPS